MTGRTVLGAKFDVSVPPPHTWPLLAHCARIGEAADLERGTGVGAGVFINVYSLKTLPRSRNLTPVRAIDGHQVPTGAAGDLTFQGSPIAFQVGIYPNGIGVAMTWDARVHSRSTIDKVIDAWRNVALEYELNGGVDSER